MLDPVYTLEWQRASRRVQKYPWRWYYAGVLLLESMWLLVGTIELFTTGSAARLAAISEDLCSLLLAQQAAVILVVAPAFAAGSITDEKRRSTLDFLLLSPLSSSEIILGKWLGQATQVLHLISPAYFMITLLAGTIGVPLRPLLLSMAEQVVLVYMLIALSLLASTWSRSTTKAIVLVYLIVGVLLLAEWLGNLSLFGPGLWGYSLSTAVPLRDHLASVVGLVFLMAVALGSSAWRLRPAHEHQHAAVNRVHGRWWDRPPIGEAPMRWKERFTGDWFSIPLWRRLPRWAKCLTVAISVAILAFVRPDPATFYVLGTVQVILSGWFVAIRSAGAITGERENQTWDSLLTTRMDAYQIVRGKLWGQIDALRPYLLAYLVPAFLGAVFTDLSAAIWIVYTWFASWVGLYYLGAIGISHSVNAASTWRSILTTLTIGQAYLMGIICLFGVLGGGIALALFGPWGLLGSSAAAFVFALALASLPGLVALFAQTEEVLQEAQRELNVKTGIELGRRTQIRPR